MFDPKPHWRTLRSVWRMLSAAVLLLPILLVMVLATGTACSTPLPYRFLPLAWPRCC
ncbi:hypothetical protein UMZ34_11900 [Halopseudomonas pachastrellae]|nr:hypothetical protein UMZ34_11900 [Halopseudomonas pachastrellae]